MGQAYSLVTRRRALQCAVSCHLQCSQRTDWILADWAHFIISVVDIYIQPCKMLVS